MQSKFINRYNSFCRSLNNLSKSRNADRNADFVLEGTVQIFNLTFDIAWKMMKDILVKNMGIVDFAIGSPREVLRMAFTNGIINSDTWLKMLNTRNQLAHDYDGTYAGEVFNDIITGYYDLFVELKDKCEQYCDEDIFDGDTK
ncbi:MAG: HI0074 family nucleotidyltransferase substrate-binding subunit [Wujia sp.]